MESEPKVSVITPTYNSGEYIRDAIESVKKQTYDNIEHIVVDGGSNDNTLKIIEEFDSVEYVSENDEGMYDAINKGIKISDGDYIGWLNSDDIYVENAFDLYKRVFKRKRRPDLIAGDSDVFKQNGEYRERLKKYEFTDPELLSKGRVTHNGIALNGCLISADFIESVGKFDSSLQIAGDAEYLYRIVSHRPTAASVDEVVYRYRSHNDSHTFADMVNNNPLWIRSDVKLRGTKEFVNFLPRYYKNKSVPAPLRNQCKEQYRERTSMLLEYYITRYNFRKFLMYFYNLIKEDNMYLIWGLRKMAILVSRRSRGINL